MQNELPIASPDEVTEYSKLEYRCRWPEGKWYVDKAFRKEAGAEPDSLGLNGNTRSGSHSADYDRVADGSTRMYKTYRFITYKTT